MRLEQLKREKYKPTEKSVSKIFILKKSGDCKEDIIYALIYDEFDFNKPKKKVISAHKARKTAEKALAKRQRKLGKKSGDVTPGSFGLMVESVPGIISRRTCLAPGRREKKSLRVTESQTELDPFPRSAGI